MQEYIVISVMFVQFNEMQADLLKSRTVLIEIKLQQFSEGNIRSMSFGVIYGAYQARSMITVTNC